jgi:hypothetical protein
MKLKYSDKSGSVRSEVSRGPNLPTTMTISHQQVTDSKLKVPATRSLLRVDRTQVLDSTTGLVGDVSAYVVVQVPQGASITSSDILAAIQSLIDVLQEDDSGLDLMDEIFVNREQ